MRRRDKRRIKSSKRDFVLCQHRRETHPFPKELRDEMRHHKGRVRIEAQFIDRTGVTVYGKAYPEPDYKLIRDTFLSAGGVIFDYITETRDGDSHRYLQVSGSDTVEWVQKKLVG